MPDRPTPLPRRTLASSATVTGVTLFTAARVTLIIRPPGPGDPLIPGVAFRRNDLAGSPFIPANHMHTVAEPRRTVLAHQDARVETVEHVLSALAGLGITDAVLELDGPEVPVGDGSAAPFTAAIQGAGIVPLPPDHTGRPAAPVRVARPFVLTDEQARMEILPAPAGANALLLEYRLDYGPGAPIPPQTAAAIVPLGEPVPRYAADIAPARTFCLAPEAQALRRMGLFAHLEARDMLVIGDDGAPIDNTLRFPDEPARHKLLDLLGDLSLTGRPIIGHVIATRSGHSLNHAAAKALAALP